MPRRQGPQGRGQPKHSETDPTDNATGNKQVKINPTRIRWVAPTENIDGTPIDYQLAYNLYVNDALTASFPGTLNPTGEYQFLFEELATPLPKEQTHEIALTAFSTDNPARESEKTPAIEVIFYGIPKAPFDLVAE